MQAYLVRRLFLAITTLLGMSILVFLSIRMVPGDPVTILMGEESDPETAARLRRQLGLDRPFYVQYFIWVNGVLHGDLGRSLMTGLPVTAELHRTVPKSLQLALASMAVAVMLGVPSGILAAVRPSSILDFAVRGVLVLGVAMPTFWLALMLVLIFAFHLRLLPAFGYGSPFTASGIKHMILPVLTLSAWAAAGISRMTRASMLEVLGESYVITARAKGLQERLVVLRHGLRNALIPVVTIIGLQLGAVLGGAVVTENVFAWPGVGRLALDAIRARDYPLVQAIALLVGCFYIFLNLLVDLLYAFLDPRIRYEAG